jgi:type I restriction enzyme S subunit
LVSGRVKLDTANKITKEKYNELSGAKIQRGDIIYCLRGTLGKNAFIDNFDSGTVASSLVDIRPKKIVGKYLFQVLNSDIEYRQRTINDEGAAQPNLSAKNLSLFDIPMSNKDEQTKIAEYFSNLDNLITLHQRECDQLKELKKSMLKKMFPRDESSIPEVRFAGFTDAWEQRKLREIAEFNPKSELPEEFEYVDLESVSGTEMISHRTELKKSAPSRAQRLAKTGDVFYQMVRPYQKNNYLFEKDDDNYVFSTGYAQMRPYIDSCFLMSFLQTDKFVKVVLDNCTGTSYPAINSNDLSNLKIDVPNKRMEEVKIGEYFRSLDNLITLHQRELEILKNLKKTCLKRMFI